MPDSVFLLVELILKSIERFISRILTFYVQWYRMVEYKT